MPGLPGEAGRHHRPDPAWGRAALLLWPALLALPVLLVLIGLGTWQMQRRAWKHDLLARIAVAESAPPVPLAAAPEAYAPEAYAKVLVTGRFRHDREALLGIAVRGGVMGAHLLTPLERGPGLPALLVDRGWVPLPPPGAPSGGAPAEPVERPGGEVAVIGYVRPAARRSWFAATDDPASRRFFTFDPAAIGAALGLASIEPGFGLAALAAPGDGPNAVPASGGPASGGPGSGAPGVGGAALPVPARSLPRPPDNHLGYAITWFGLALALVGVFAAWARHRLKEPPEPP